MTECTICGLPFNETEHQYRFKFVSAVGVNGWGNETTYHTAHSRCYFEFRERGRVFSVE